MKKRILITVWTLIAVGAAIALPSGWDTDAYWYSSLDNVPEGRVIILVRGYDLSIRQHDPFAVFIEGNPYNARQQEAIKIAINNTTPRAYRIVGICLIDYASGIRYYIRLWWGQGGREAGTRVWLWENR